MKVYRVRYWNEVNDWTGKWRAEKKLLMEDLERAIECVEEDYGDHGYFLDEYIKLDIIDDIVDMLNEHHEYAGDDALYFDEDKGFKSVRVGYMLKSDYDDKEGIQLYDFYVDYGFIDKCIDEQ